MPVFWWLASENRRLRSTPFDVTLDAYRENDSLFIQNLHQLSVGLNVLPLFYSGMQKSDDLHQQTSL